MPSPDKIRIITVIAFVVLSTIGLKWTVFLSVSYLILVYCKISSYYPFFASINSELLFAILILIRLFLKGNFAIKLSPGHSAINKYLYLFIGCILLSFLFAWNRQYSWNEAIYHFLKVVLLYIFIALSLEEEKDLKIFIWSLILMYVYLSYEPIYYFITGTGGSVQYYGTNYIAQIGILSGHVAAGNNMNQMIPIIFYLFMGIQKRSLKILAGIPLVVFILCLIGTGSRGGLIGFLFFGFLVVYFSQNRFKSGSFVIILLFFIVGYTAFTSTASRIGSRSIWQRFIGLTHGIEMVKRGNIFGVGPGCFLFARSEYFHWRMEAHNTYGQVMGELGIPGTIVWFLFIRQIFHYLNESKKRLKALSMEKSFMYSLVMGLLVSLCVRLFVSMASHSLYFFYWYVVAPLSFIIFENVKKMESITEIEKTETCLLEPLDSEA